MTAATAVVFPGQGSQFVGMLNELGHLPTVTKLFTQASDLLGYDLWQICQRGPKEQLDQTAITQPALLTASYALWCVWQEFQTISPAMIAGHSLGEYTALVCAQALDFADAVKLVAARGKFMQEAVANISGAMAAIIGLSDEEVAAVCNQAKQADEVLSIANYNSIGQTVIAGHYAAVIRAIEIAKEKKAKMAVLIPVSVPSHCPLMAPAAERLAGLLNTISLRSPNIPVINNVDVVPYTDAASIRLGLTKQLSAPVRWVETIQLFAAKGITSVIECGPGKVLTGLNKRIDKTLTLQSAEQMCN